jgi:tetratricopeptide (TPR) repeat protein
MKQELDIPQAIGLGVKLFSEGKKVDAENLFRRSLEADPGNLKAMFWIGICAFENGNLFEALYRFERVIKADRRDPVALANCGMVMSELGHNDEAETYLRRAVAVDRNAHIAWVNLSNVLTRLGRMHEAIECADWALSLKRDDTAYFNRGIARYSLDDVEGAVHDYDSAILLTPDHAEAIYNRANALLKLGHLKDGFRDYDARLSTSEAGNYHYFKPTAPRWNGEDLAGKTLLIHSEQGIGDSIMFMRYAEIAEVQRAKQVIIVPHTALLSICREHFLEGNGYLVHPAADKQYPEHDFYTLLMSIPRIVGTDLDSIPPQWQPHEQFLGCDRCDFWRQRILHGASITEQKHVGICWSGNWIHKNDAHRSMTLEQFAPIVTSRPGVVFHSLQKDVRPCDEAMLRQLGIVDHREHLTDMRETAHVIGLMDEVISVDTSVAHLAATMGAKTTILLPKFRTDWRWMMGTDKSPWYQTVKLLRQTKIGDWSVSAKRRAAA